MAIKFLNTVQVDTDVLYVDASSNRVGIGTTSPSTVLEVSSTGVNGVDISQSASNASQSGRLFFTTNTASEGFALFNSNGTFQVNSGGIPNNTSGTNRISIIGSSGNVGIGTTSPSTKLHVSGGDIRIDDTERIEFGAGGVRINNDAAGRMYLNAPLAYYWQAGSGYKMVLLNSGNVGIGTTSPSYQLQVTGDSSSSPLLQVDDDGDAYLQIKPDASTIFKIGDIDALGNEAVIVGSYSDLRFNNLGSTTMIVNNLNRVGIGTTSPATKLHVSGGDIRIDDTERIEFGAGGVRINNDAAGRMYLNAPLAYYWQAGSGYKMVLLNSGNVGIGTTSPDSKLNIEGTKNTAILTLGNTTSGSTWVVGDRVGGIDFYSADGSGGGIGVKASISYEEAAGGTGSSQAMVFRTGGTSAGTNNVERMRLQYNGNVGIGTTSPSEKLEVDGDVKADNYINQRVAWNVGFLANSVNTSSYYYIPVGYLSETTSNQYYNNWVASYAGRVRKIVMRNLGTSTVPTATTVNFRVSVNGSVVYTGSTITVTGSGLNILASETLSDTDAVFSATDRVQVAYRTNGLWQYVATSISLEYTE